MIEGFSFIVLLAFFLLCWKYYKLNKKKNFLYLGLGFLLIAVAQLATILTKLVLYYDTTFTRNIGQIVVTYKIVNSVDIFYNLGFFFSKLLILAGFYILYKLHLKKKWTGDSYLVLFFIFVTALCSLNTYYYVFHLAVIILLLLIIKNYYRIYKENYNYNTKILIIAFSILVLSQLIFLLSKLQVLYVMANFIELVSYLILIILIIRILKHGKKKKSNGYNSRHIKIDTGKRRRD